MKLLTVLTVTFALITSLLAYLHYDNVRVHKEWIASASQAEGLVVEVLDGRKGGPSGYVVVEFTPPGGRPVRARIDDDHWSAATMAWPDRGDRVRVAYDPADPAGSAVDAQFAYSDVLSEASIPAGFTLVSLGLLIVAVWRGRRASAGWGRATRR